MFRNRMLRTKLVCILLVPIGALVGLSVAQAWDQYSSAPPAGEAAARDELVRTLELLAAVGAGAVAFTILATRMVARPLQGLTTAAQVLAEEKLPAAVASLRSPADEDLRYLSTALSPIEVGRRDEIGQLTVALNQIHTTAVDLAAEHSSLVRKGIARIFVDLARANQRLVDAQLGELDELETDERDPQRLERLFRVDHLAIRARRAVESLLVLAGLERERDVDDPVPLLDIVRAGVAQVEDLARVDVLKLDTVSVVPDVAIDLAHLLAEILDAGLHSSPPETSVEVRGHPGRSGYVLSITDTGVGMPGDRMAAVNALLAHPPPSAFAPLGQVGLVVAGRLAGRHRMSIRLAPGPDAGTVALVSIPAGLLGAGWDRLRDGKAADTQTPDMAAAKVPEPAPAPAPAEDPGDLDSLLAEGWADGWEEPVSDDEVPEEELDEAGRL